MEKNDIKKTLHKMLKDEECRQLGRLISHLRTIKLLWEEEAIFDDHNITEVGTELLRYLCCEIIDAIDDIKSRCESIALLRESLTGGEEK